MFQPPLLRRQMAMLRHLFPGELHKTALWTLGFWMPIQLDALAHVLVIAYLQRLTNEEGIGCLIVRIIQYIPSW